MEKGHGYQTSKKKNKKYYSAPKSYRPISLLPYDSKLLERVFARRLSCFANISPRLLHEGQIGGRKKRSATDAAVLLQNFVENQLGKGRKVTTVFLDIMGAFDRLL